MGLVFRRGEISPCHQGARLLAVRTRLLAIARYVLSLPGHFRISGMKLARRKLLGLAIGTVAAPALRSRIGIIRHSSRIATADLGGFSFLEQGTLFLNAIFDATGHRFQSGFDKLDPPPSDAELLEERRGRSERQCCPTVVLPIRTRWL
jgi:hypothetical protein